MKKFLIGLLVLALSCTAVVAKGSTGGHNGGSHGAPHGSGHHNGPGHSHGSGGESHPVYLVRTEDKIEEIKFQNCNDHYAIMNSIINYYSDGSKRIETNGTIYYSDGTVLEADCQSINHVIYKDEHYFIIKKTTGYKIIDSKGKILTKKAYSKMTELKGKENRVLVRRDKKYGIIDLHEGVIVPTKYKKFEPVGDKIFITQLNGYYGILDIDNNILISP